MPFFGRSAITAVTNIQFTLALSISAVERKQGPTFDNKLKDEPETM
ncbi:hypothetical protein Ngar_c25850 [Candidatus Nitrososphaera gargensis Ga9.2]|uniref:Uncharacterized protein n=1 Tax=Nitrososphaera gargensis (strain Ga9.2) TaxID=1237085 RepID=K0ILI9_NITGG|nr:hypothetical protein Ngar_c25850 [Candidatus Nitrososphaera gargensis Ga9.2]